jgi:tetratricopeptide (TPR) repeat protein
MRRLISYALVLAGCLTALPRLLAQAPATQQGKPAAENQKPPDAPEPGKTATTSSTNPFPEDTTTVPVMPSATTLALPEGRYSGAESAGIPLSGAEVDPVRSPDDPEPEASSGQEDSSSSLSGLERLLPKPEEDQRGKKKKILAVKEPTHEEAAGKDIQVGNYYLDRKNWKGALSRFESALVLDPENPEVYWGLAESAYHLGDFANARVNLLKLLDYDPEGPHSKQARKELNEPAVANAKDAAPSQPATDAAK